MTKKIKVLMVDDEAKFRETTSKILDKRGFETTMAGTGEEAIEILKKNPQDVIVLDIRMPGMDGHDALEKIKKISPDTQVIMLTGHGGHVSAKASLELGAFDYLNKPCDLDLLTAKINDAYNALRFKENRPEKTAGEIMIRVEDYTTITEDKTLKDAIVQLLQSFEGLAASKQVMETGHRSILVFNRDGELSGILSIYDLLGAVRPGYLSAAKPSMADSVQYSTMFWSGLFTTQMKAIANKKVGEFMSVTPFTVDEDANLMELSEIMYSRKIRRLVVKRGEKVVGVVREQELFFEMANIIVKQS